MTQHLVRFAKFGFVGASGVIVNVAIFELVRWTLGDWGDQALRVFVSNAAGIVVSIFTNFMLNDQWTWADRNKGGRSQWWSRLGKYYTSASVAAVVQLSVTQIALMTYFGAVTWMFHGKLIGPTIALLSGIACGMVVNFLASHLWAFKDA